MPEKPINWERPATLAAFGAALRRRREAMDMTLDVLAQATGISKPYLSNIETARAPGPPSEEKLRAMARALTLPEEKVVAGADWLRTPASIRKALGDLSGVAGGATRDMVAEKKEMGIEEVTAREDSPRRADGTIDLDQLVSGAKKDAPSAGDIPRMPRESGIAPRAGRSAGPGGRLPLRQVPLINRVAAGQAAEFGDLSYPAGVADQYITAPDLPEAPVASAFAVKVIGDSMLPEYQAGDIVIVGAGDPKDGDDCVVRLGELEHFATTFKRVWFEKNEAGETTGVRLVALNKEYGEKTVAVEDITGIYPLMYRLVPARKAGDSGWR